MSHHFLPLSLLRSLQWPSQPNLFSSCKDSLNKNPEASPSHQAVKIIFQLSSFICSAWQKTTYCTFYLLFLFGLQRNVKEMMDVNGIRVLVDLLTLAHLHTSRAVVPLQVICHMCGMDLQKNKPTA